MMTLSDRILVICNGEVVGIVNPDDVTKEDLGLMMAGKRPDNIKYEEAGK